MKKFYSILLEINCYFLILAAIFCGADSIIGAVLFCYTSIIGLIDAIKTRNKNGLIINCTFLALNSFNLIKFALEIR